MASDIDLIGYKSGKIVKPDGGTGSIDTIGINDGTKLQIGTGDDLKLYHDGNHSYISHDGTGELKIATETNRDVAIGTTGSTVAIGNHLTVAGNTVVSGNLTVNGDTTTLTTTNTAIQDNLIILNNGASSNANDSGILIERGSTGDNAIFAWDESKDKFALGTTTAVGTDTGNLSISLGDLNLSGLTATGTVTFGTLTDGGESIAVTKFVDESDGIANNDNDTTIPTSAAVKAYVDAQVTAQDLDFQGDSGGALSIDLDSETLTFTGGTGIDTSGSSNTLTIAIDSTVATLAGSQTLTNKTLTSPTVSGLALSDSSIVFEGSTEDANELTLTVADPSSDVTVTIQAATDTLVGRATTDTLTNKTLTSAVLNTGVSGSAVLDEDDMSSDSATQLATQQSIKAYVDSQVASGGSGSTFTMSVAKTKCVLDTTNHIIPAGTIMELDGSGSDEFATESQQGAYPIGVLTSAVNNSDNNVSSNAATIHTVPGQQVNTKFDSAPAVTDVGNPVYLTSAALATVTAPTSGNVVKLGILRSAAVASGLYPIIWQPQFIAEL